MNVSRPVDSLMCQPLSSLTTLPRAPFSVQPISMFSPTYLTSPGQIVIVHSAFVQWDQEARARVAVGEGQFGGRHFFAGGFYKEGIVMLESVFMACDNACCCRSEGK